MKDILDIILRIAILILPALGAMFLIKVDGSAGDMCNILCLVLASCLMKVWKEL